MHSARMSRVAQRYGTARPDDASYNYGVGRGAVAGYKTFTATHGTSSAWRGQGGRHDREAHAFVVWWKVEHGEMAPEACEANRRNYAEWFTRFEKEQPLARAAWEQLRAGVLTKDEQKQVCERFRNWFAKFEREA